MIFSKKISIESTFHTDAVLRCYETHMCAAVQNCGAGNNTATINAENYEAVKSAYSPSPHS